ncbi:MAG: NADH ubiquinone oxidoreductase 20 kDa subunit [Halothiobacillaceae bacterium]|nr:MAG: NADH ubiquinone oxidoreductase 20 kDa subunit [Halothiobacillaceae bacterium]
MNLMDNGSHKPRIAVHKLSSCDGCQLAFLNAGEALLALATLVDIVHFAEAGYVASTEQVAIAFVEGSISTPDELRRIEEIRAHSHYLITLGACATAGGVQALRNLAADSGTWVPAIYATPQYIESLATVTPVSAHVRVDFELWGCPVSTRQLLELIRALLFGVTPVDHHETVCLDCKRAQHVCVMVSRNLPCMGPVTRTGCGALCPQFNRGCYGCYGPAESQNSAALARHWLAGGAHSDDVARRFHSICNSAPAFSTAGKII